MQKNVHSFWFQKMFVYQLVVSWDFFMVRPRLQWNIRVSFMIKATCDLPLYFYDIIFILEIDSYEIKVYFFPFRS